MKDITKTAIGIGMATWMGLVGAQGALLFEVDANTDSDPTDGWSYTGTMGPGVLPVSASGSGDVVRSTQATQAYFSRSMGGKAFTGDTTNTATISNWSIEIWLRRTGLELENQVLNFRDSSFNAFISISGNSQSAPVDPDFDHRDFNGVDARSKVLDAFPWPEGVWQQWVVTYQDSTGGPDTGLMSIYLNGAPVDVFPQDTNQKPFHQNLSTLGTAALFIVADPGDFKGMVGDLAIVRLYDNILTPGEISASFSTTSAALGFLPPQDVTFTNVNLVDTIGMQFLSENLTEYTLQFTTDLVSSSNWMNAATVIGTGTNLFFFDPTESTGSSTGKAYRILSP